MNFPANHDWLLEGGNLELIFRHFGDFLVAFQGRYIFKMSSTPTPTKILIQLMDSNFQLVEIWFFPTSQLMNPISPRKRFCFSSSVSLVASCCQATLQYSVFENYISALHPGKSASTCAMVKLRGLFSHCGFGMVSIFFHRDSYAHDVWIPDMGWMTI